MRYLVLAFILQTRIAVEARHATCVAAVIIAGCALVGQAHADTPLQNQMQRLIELEQVDKWCTGTHEIDFDRLRTAIQAERDKGIAMADSEKDARIA
jgi:hypothetical protein